MKMKFRTKTSRSSLCIWECRWQWLEEEWWRAPWAHYLQMSQIFPLPSRKMGQQSHQGHIYTLENLPPVEEFILCSRLVSIEAVDYRIQWFWGVVMFYPWLFCPSDNVWRSRHVDALRCLHFSTVITPSWITQLISIAKFAHWGMHRERQTMLKIVTWTKQTWTKHM